MVDGKTPDRRVRKTRAALRHALAELMQHKPVQEITVRELSEICDINRGTFYIHYRDVFDMVAQIEQELMVEFQAVLSEFPIKDVDNDPRKLIKGMFEFLAGNADMGKALLGENGDINFVNKLKAMVRDQFCQVWLAERDGSSAELTDYYASFVISGFVGLFETWLQHGMKETPIAMSAIAESLIMGSIHN